MQAWWGAAQEIRLLFTVFLLLFLFPSLSTSLFLLLTNGRETLTVIPLLKYVLFLTLVFALRLFFSKTKIICSCFFDVRSCDHHLWCCHSFLFVYAVFLISHNESVFAEHIHIFALKVTIMHNLIFLAAAAFRLTVMLKSLSSQFTLLNSLV